MRNIAAPLVVAALVMGAGSAAETDTKPDTSDAPGATTHWLGKGGSPPAARHAQTDQRGPDDGTRDPGRGGRSGGRHRERHGGVIIVPYPEGPPYQDGYYSFSEGAGGDAAERRDGGSGTPHGAFWYFCNSPAGYYPYVKTCSQDWNGIAMAPPPLGTPEPVGHGMWEWCDQPRGFFPYVKRCAKAWIATPVTAPKSENSPESPPVVSSWFYCDEPKGWMPYVSVCAKDWRAVPSVPPQDASDPETPPSPVAPK